VAGFSAVDPEKAYYGLLIPYVGTHLA